MLKITKELLHSRYDLMSRTLKEALFSEESADLAWKINKRNHLTDEQAGVAAGIIGDVIMGFLHPHDLAAEIAADLGIDKRVAATIAEEVDRKIFAPIRGELETNYKPAAAPVSGQTPEAPAPETREEVAPKEAPPFPSPPPVPPAEIKAVPPEEPPAASPPTALGTGKIETTAPSDEPFILHREETLRPILDAKKISFEPPTPPPPSQTKPATARLEMGELGKEKGNKVSAIYKTKTEPQRVVHYSDLKTAIGPAGEPVAPAVAPAASPAEPPAGESPPAEHLIDLSVIGKAEGEEGGDNTVNLKSGANR